MPVLIAARSSDESTGLSNTRIVAGVLVAAVGMLLFIVFGRKLWGRIVKRIRLWVTPSPSSSPSPAMIRGGITHPTSTPRRFKSWRKISTEGSVYGGVRGDLTSPLPSPGAPSHHTRSVSTFSKASDAGQNFPVLSVPPPAHTA